MIFVVSLLCSQPMRYHHSVEHSSDADGVHEWGVKLKRGMRLDSIPRRGECLPPSQNRHHRQSGARSRRHRACSEWGECCGRRQSRLLVDHATKRDLRSVRQDTGGPSAYQSLAGGRIRLPGVHATVRSGEASGATIVSLIGAN